MHRIVTESYCRYYLVQAGPIQHRFCLNPPPPPSEAPNSTTLNYFLIELAKHLRNKWLTNHLKSRYCLWMRKLINPRELYRYTPTNRKHQHFQWKRHLNKTQCCLDTYGEQEAPANTSDRVCCSAPSVGTNKGNLQPLYNVEILLHYVACTIKCP